jgi:hypothetical protein
MVGSPHDTVSSEGNSAKVLLKKVPSKLYDATDSKIEYEDDLEKGQMQMSIQLPLEDCIAVRKSSQNIVFFCLF